MLFEVRFFLFLSFWSACVNLLPVTFMVHIMTITLAPVVEQCIQYINGVLHSSYSIFHLDVGRLNMTKYPPTILNVWWRMCRKLKGGGVIPGHSRLWCKWLIQTNVPSPLQNITNVQSRQICRFFFFRIWQM